MPGSSPGMTISYITHAAPRRASTRIALHAGPVPHQREVAALAAHLAFVALGLGFGAAFGLAGATAWRGGAGLAPLQGFQLFGRRQVVARLPASARPRLRWVSETRALGPWRGDRGDVAGRRGRRTSATPRITTRLSVRERVRPFDRYLLAWRLLRRACLPRRPCRCASKLDSVGSTWARSKRPCS